MTMPYLNNDIVHVGYRCLIMCFFNKKSADQRKRINDTDTNKKDGSHRIVMKPVCFFIVHTYYTPILPYLRSYISNEQDL